MVPEVEVKILVSANAQCVKCVQFTPQISVFSMNTGKYRPEITPYLDIFHAVAGECFRQKQ